MLNYSVENYNTVLGILRNKDNSKYSRVVMLEPEKRSENEQQLQDYMKYIEDNAEKGENDPAYKTRLIHFKEFCELAEKEFDVTL